MGVRRGADELGRLLREQTWDVRHLDPAGFRAWLGCLLARWAHAPVFRQWAAIRDLRRSRPELRPLERAYRAAAAADAAAPASARLRAMERAAADAGKAVSGLAAALAHAPPDRRHGLAAKLGDAQARVRALEAERAALARVADERRGLVRAEDALRRVRAVTGLDRAEARLAVLLTARGRRAGRAGDAFEDAAAAAAARDIAPELAAGWDVRVVRRVRLGSAGAEFDALVVRAPAAGGVAEVLAAVEAKRDVNGLAHGFLRRQADLSWLTGEAGAYDPAAYRTRWFPTGHFDRDAEHRDADAVVTFGPGSFARFRRDAGSGWFVGGLYLVTRPGPVWGVSPAALARIASRVATDEDFNPDDAGVLAELRGRCLALAGPVESPDVLRLYAGSPIWGRQVLLIEGGAPAVSGL